MPTVILGESGREYSPGMVAFPWLLLVIGALGASTTMVCVWLVSILVPRPPKRPSAAP